MVFEAAARCEQNSANQDPPLAACPQPEASCAATSIPSQYSMPRRPGNQPAAGRPDVSQHASNVHMGILDARDLQELGLMQTSPEQSQNAAHAMLSTPPGQVGTIGDAQLQQKGLIQGSSPSAGPTRVAFSQRMGHAMSTALRAITATPARLMRSFDRRPAPPDWTSPASPRRGRPSARNLRLSGDPAPTDQAAPSFAEWASWAMWRDAL